MACHQHRAVSLSPTHPHLSSNSASIPTGSRSLACFEANVWRISLLTCWRPVAFLERMNDRRRTNPKHSDDITYATAAEPQVHDSLFDLRQASGMVVLQQKDAPGTVRIVTPIALGAIRLLAIFDHGDPVTLGAPHKHNRHHRSPSRSDTFVPGGYHTINCIKTRPASARLCRSGLTSRQLSRSR
jgi:hypothetical protein